MVFIHTINHVNIVSRYKMIYLHIKNIYISFSKLKLLKIAKNKFIYNIYINNNKCMLLCISFIL